MRCYISMRNVVSCPYAPFNIHVKTMFIQKYSEFHLSKAGIRSDLIPGTRLSAHFKFDTDVSLLFPYINATCKEAKFHDNPEYIQFMMNGIFCTLYPNDVIAAPFEDQDQALEFADRLMAFLNDLYANRDSIEPNHRKFRPLSAIDIYKLLPKTNCGECGFPACLAFASALSRGQVHPDQCPGFSNPIYENAVYPVYDKAGNLVSTVAVELETTARRSDSKHREEPDEEKQNNQPLSDGDPMGVQSDLTDREVQVLRLVADGATNNEISDALSISPHTVKSHIVHILNKLGANDRTQAAVWATRNDII